MADNLTLTEVCEGQALDLWHLPRGVRGKGEAPSSDSDGQPQDIQVRVEENEGTTIITITNLPKHRSMISDDKGDQDQQMTQAFADHPKRRKQHCHDLGVEQKALTIPLSRNEVHQSTSSLSKHDSDIAGHSTEKPSRLDDTSPDSDEGAEPTGMQVGVDDMAREDVGEEDDEHNDGEVQAASATHYCPRCGLAFVGAAEMREHATTHKGRTTYVCYQCKKSFRGSSNLKRHVRETHEKHRSKVCPTCNSSFFNNASLANHQRKVHQGGNSRAGSRCDHCNQEFPHRSGLYRHLQKTHAADLTEGERNTIESWSSALPRFICETCGKELASRGSLFHHQLTHTKERRFPCPRCDWAATTKANLDRHMRTHTGERPFQCGSCEATFGDRSALIQHSRIHSGEKPHKCHLCDKSFIQSCALKSHMVCHTKQRDYKCGQCSATFLRQSHLWLHTLKHNTEPKYRCGQDGAVFYTKGDLSRHKKSHTEEGLHHCDKCDKKYKQSSSLRYHQMSHQTPAPEKRSATESLTEVTSADLDLTPAFPEDAITEQPKLPSDMIPLQDSLVQISADTSGPQAITLGILKTVQTEEGVRYILVTQPEVDVGQHSEALLATPSACDILHPGAEQPIASEEDEVDVLKYLNKDGTEVHVANVDTEEDKEKTQRLASLCPSVSSSALDSDDAHQKQDSSVSIFTVPMACGVLSSLGGATVQLSDQPVVPPHGGLMDLPEDAGHISTESLGLVLGIGDSDNNKQHAEMPYARLSQSSSLSAGKTPVLSTCMAPAPLHCLPSTSVVPGVNPNTSDLHNTILHSNALVVHKYVTTPSQLLRHDGEVSQTLSDIGYHKILMTSPSSAASPHTVTLGSVTGDTADVSLRQFVNGMSVVPQDLVTEVLPRMHVVFSSDIRHSTDDPNLHSPVTQSALVKSETLLCPDGLINDGNVKKDSSESPS